MVRDRSATKAKATNLRILVSHLLLIPRPSEAFSECVTGGGYLFSSKTPTPFGSGVHSGVGPCAKPILFVCRHTPVRHDGQTGGSLGAGTAGCQSRVRLSQNGVVRSNPMGSSNFQRSF